MPSETTSNQISCTTTSDEVF